MHTLLYNQWLHFLLLNKVRGKQQDLHFKLQMRLRILSLLIFFLVPEEHMAIKQLHMKNKIFPSISMGKNSKRMNIFRQGESTVGIITIMHE